MVGSSVRLIVLVGITLLPQLLFVEVLARPASSISSSIEENIEGFVEALSKCKYIKGLTLAVVQNDRVVMSKGFGYRNLETKEKVDERTLFGIASLTKAFVAATLSKIQDDYNITLSTPLNDFMNITFPTKKLNDYVTLEDLLSHRTGLTKNNYLRLNPRFNRQTLHRYLKYFGVQKDFRTSFIYHNIMYGLASSITEHLTDLRWEEAVSTHLLQPLGMNETTFSTVADDERLNIAYPYLFSRGEMGYRRISPDFTRKWAELGGSGAMLSNAVDMARWMRFLLNKGELEGQRVMNEAHVEDLFKPRNYPGPRNTSFTRPNSPITISDDLYSMGWKEGYYRGFPIITHTGSTWGYKAMLTLFPGQRLGIFNAQIGSDDNYIKRRLLHSYIADLYLGEQPWLNRTSVCSFPWTTNKNKLPIKPKQKQTKTIPTPVLDKAYNFTGVYTNKLWGELSIDYNDTSLNMVYGYASFRLNPSEDPLIFNAVGLDELWFMKLSSVEFKTDAELNKEVVSVTVPTFEKTQPPTFRKVTDGL